MTVPSNCKRWTAWERAAIRRHYPSYSNILQKLPHRSYDAVRAEARNLGLVPQRKNWSGRSLKVATAVNGTMSRKEIAKLLPGETAKRIGAMLRYFKIKRERRPFARSGDAVINQLLDRAFEKQMTLSQLDKLAKAKGYFASRRFDGSTNYQHVDSAAQVLDGELVVEWDD